jgi:hypothetical protein
MSFRVEFDWEDGTGVSDPALAATWARISIHLGGEPLRVYHFKDVRTGFYGSLLPLAEWIVDSWPRLMHERMLPAHDVALRRWRGFHSLQTAREGGAMPDLRLRRLDSVWTSIELVPDERPLPGVSARFLDRIRERVAATQVEKSLGTVVEECCKRLDNVDSNRASGLRRDWQRNRTKLADYSARLEPDQELLSDEGHALIAQLETDPKRDLVIEIAEALVGRSLRERLDAARVLATTVNPSPASPGWLEIKLLASQRFIQPWLTGWAAAAGLRNALSLRSDHIFAGTLSQFCAARCGWPVEQQLYVVAELPSFHFDTLHARSATRLPLVVTVRRMPYAQQFRLARSLYYSLVVGREVQELEAIVDIRHAPFFSEASAFAAELLAPANYLKQEMPADGIWKESYVTQVATSLMVSPLVIKHQIENRQIGELELDASD